MLSRTCEIHPTGSPRDIAIVEQWDDLLFQFRVERLGFGSVGLLIIDLLLLNRPTNARFIGLGPPAIEFRKIYAAVGEHLHAARAACFPRASRVINPNIHTMHQLFSQQHVIVGKEYYVRTHFRATTNEICPLTNQRLSRFICGVGLARNKQLHRTMRISQKPHQPLRIVQQ